MLLVANFGQYKMILKTWKTTETLAHRYSSESIQRELSNEYQGLNDFQKTLRSCALDESSLKAL